MYFLYKSEVRINQPQFRELPSNENEAYYYSFIIILFMFFWVDMYWSVTIHKWTKLCYTVSCLSILGNSGLNHLRKKPVGRNEIWSKYCCFSREMRKKWEKVRAVGWVG